eukprot:Clim_evm3s217 gene=Clim_evmTU3s217
MRRIPDSLRRARQRAAAPQMRQLMRSLEQREEQQRQQQQHSQSFSSAGSSHQGMQTSNQRSLQNSHSNQLMYPSHMSLYPETGTYFKVVANTQCPTTYMRQQGSVTSKFGQNDSSNSNEISSSSDSTMSLSSGGGGGSGSSGRKGGGSGSKFEDDGSGSLRVLRIPTYFGMKPFIPTRHELFVPNDRRTSAIVRHALNGHGIFGYLSLNMGLPVPQADWPCFDVGTMVRVVRNLEDTDLSEISLSSNSASMATNTANVAPPPTPTRQLNRAPEAFRQRSSGVTAGSATGDGTSSGASGNVDHKEYLIEGFARFEVVEKHLTPSGYFEVVPRFLEDKPLNHSEQTQALEIAVDITNALGKIYRSASAQASSKQGHYERVIDTLRNLISQHNLETFQWHAFNACHIISNPDVNHMQAVLQMTSKLERLSWIRAQLQRRMMQSGL